MKLLRATVALALPAAALTVCSSAWAHAHVSPPVAQSGESQVFTVAVPNEEEDANITKIELTPPEGFSVGSFVDAPGWTRDVQSTGSGEDTVIQKVTWSGGEIPPEEATNFQFLGRADDGTYALAVRQTYSNGTVVDWSEPESSDTPAPVIETKSLGAGGGFSFLSLLALILAVVALLVALGSLLVRSGGRALA